MNDRYGRRYFRSYWDRQEELRAQRQAKQAWLRKLSGRRF